jgi:hypothetical protein
MNFCGTIYIAGASYSGKTQLRLMLSAHPNILITRRTYMWRQFYNQYGFLGDPENLDTCLNAILASKHIQVLNPDPERIRQEFNKGTPEYARLFSIIHQQYVTRFGKKRWGNQHKSIEDDVDLIFASEPSAVVIHMVRHPFDRVGESVSQAQYRKGRVGLETTLWRKSSQMALRNQKRYPDRYLVLQCEQLFAFPKRTLQDICDFLGETFNPAMLEIEGLLEMGVAVSGSNTSGKMTSSQKIGESQMVLSHAEQSFIQSLASVEMGALGYRKIEHQPSFLNWIKYLLVEYPFNLAGATLWDIWRRRKLNASNIFRS